MRCSAVALIFVLLAWAPAVAADSYMLTDADRSALFAHPGAGAAYLYLSERGPISEMLSLAGRFAIDPSGNRIGISVAEQRVYMISAAGQFSWLAGTGSAGFRDGPGYRAMFNAGGSGYAYGGVAVDSQGRVYVADGSNQRIRQITQQADGTWEVSTFAGGGMRRLLPGATAGPTEAQLAGPMAVAVDASDQVWFFDSWNLYRVSGGVVTAYSRVPDVRQQYAVVVDMAADRRGTVYALVRGNRAAMLWRIPPDGRVLWMAGISEAEWGAYVAAGQPVPVDGPVDTASFFGAGTLAVEEDGSAVYLGGGDETRLRRIKDGRVSQLSTTGTWIELTSRGAGIEFWGVAAIDEQGRIYSYKPHWRPPDVGQWAATRMAVPGGTPPPPPPPPTGSLENRLIVTERAGAAQSQYPIQIGRPFRAGEILHFPQALVDDLEIPTQAVVKTRWSDGSAQHAILNFVLPTLPANGSVVVTFRDQASGGAPSGTSPGLTGVSASLTPLGTASCDAMRAQATIWLDGPIATTWVLADHRGKSFDLGSVRPICEVTHWHGLGKTFVRFIAEIADTERLADVSYAVTLQPSGETSPVWHQAATRWTRTFWLGGAPPRVDIDHGLAYLASTGAIPNYDPSKVVSEAVIAGASAQWLASNRGLWIDQWNGGGYGNLHAAMGAAGGRPELGPYPTWVVRWLYTGDSRMQDQALGNADIGARWPMHYREGNATKAAFGQPIRITDRPTIALVSGLSYGYTAPADKIVPLAPLGNSPWRPDISHQPDLHSVPYLLTGEHWYLEEAEFWASWSAAYPNGAARNSWCGRGPTGAEGGIPGMQCISMRGQAWAIRNRAQVAWLLPDDAPAKSYYTQLVAGALCIWEGGRDITWTLCEGTPSWTWGKTVDQPRGPHPLRFWERGNSAFTSAPVDSTLAGAGISTWEQHFMMYALGRVRELGFPAGPLAAWLGQQIAGQVIGAGANPYLVATYRIPTADKANVASFTDWGAVVGAYAAGFDFAANFRSQLLNTDHGYALVAIPAMAAAGDPVSWEWMRTHALTAGGLMANPKWAILPR